MLHLLVKGFYEVCLHLPIRVGKFKAKFVKAKRVLKVQMEAQPEETAAKEQINPTIQPKVLIQSDLLEDIL